MKTSTTEQNNKAYDKAVFWSERRRKYVFGICDCKWNLTRTMIAFLCIICEQTLGYSKTEDKIALSIFQGYMGGISESQILRTRKGLERLGFIHYTHGKWRGDIPKYSIEEDQSRWIVRPKQGTWKKWGKDKPIKGSIYMTPFKGESESGKGSILKNKGYHPDKERVASESGKGSIQMAVTVDTVDTIDTIEEDNATLKNSNFSIDETQKKTERAARRIGELVPAEQGKRTDKELSQDSAKSIIPHQRLSEFRKLAEIPEVESADVQTPTSVDKKSKAEIMQELLTLLRNNPVPDYPDWYDADPWLSEKEAEAGGLTK